MLTTQNTTNVWVCNLGLYITVASFDQGTHNVKESNKKEDKNVAEILTKRGKREKGGVTII
jgi:hypothetical protein